MTNTQDELIKALYACREKFNFYAEQHAAKGGFEKERVNREMVSMINETLARAAEQKDVQPEQSSAVTIYVMCKELIEAGRSMRDALIEVRTSPSREACIQWYKETYGSLADTNHLSFVPPVE